MVMALTARRWLSLRRRFYHSSWPPRLYLLFLAGFFFVPNSKWHNDFYYALVLPPFLLSVPLSRLRAISRSATFRLSAAFLTYLVGTLLWSAHTGLREVLDHGAHLLYLLAFLALTVDLCLREPGFTDRLLAWLAGSAVTGATLSIAVFYFYAGHPFPAARLEGLGQLDHPIELAIAYTAVGLMAYFGPLGAASTARWPRWLSWLVFLICLATAILSQSRGPLLALGLTLVAAAGYLREGRSTALLLLALLLLLGGLLLAPGELLSVLLRHGWDSYRLQIWSQALGQIAQAPWLGSGITAEGTYQTAIGRLEWHPHNIFLATLLYGGIIALILLLALLWRGLRVALREAHEVRSPALAVVLTFSCLAQLTDGYRLLSHPKPSWLYFWLPIALLCAAELSGACRGAVGLSSEQPRPCGGQQDGRAS